MTYEPSQGMDTEFSCPNCGSKWTSVGWTRRYCTSYSLECGSTVHAHMKDGSPDDVFQSNECKGKVRIAELEKRIENE